MIDLLAEFIHPPVPFRDMDWAVTRVGYDEGDPVGYGLTKEAATADLLQQEEERQAEEEKRRE